MNQCAAKLLGEFKFKSLQEEKPPSVLLDQMLRAHFATAHRIGTNISLGLSFIKVCL
jgi:hypothetical protein